MDICMYVCVRPDPKPNTIAYFIDIPILNIQENVRNPMMPHFMDTTNSKCICIYKCLLITISVLRL